MTNVVRMCLLLVVLAVGSVHARQQGEEPQPIADNSFFIEEAYNQEEGIVQHISGFLIAPSPNKLLGYTFTQEWPLGSQLHQLSYTLPLMLSTPENQSGLGDALINYRLQLLSGEYWAAVAPRLSLLVPTGSADRGLGSGVVGVQANIPASKRLSRSVVVHANLGFTYVPNIKDRSALNAEKKYTTTILNAGASAIWLATQNFNLMLEYTSARSSNRFDDGGTESSTESIVCPGIRFAINLPSLQIVPGIGMPVIFSRESTRTGIFLYFSFEHPF